MAVKIDRFTTIFNQFIEFEFTDFNDYDSQVSTCESKKVFHILEALRRLRIKIQALEFHIRQNLSTILAEKFLLSSSKHNREDHN